MVILSIMAIVVGMAGAGTAWVLIRLIALFTNIAYNQKLAVDTWTIVGNHLGWWAVLVPMVGGLIVGLMARYGSDKIRGHGIPEAMEAILIGGSRIDAKVAILKPLSSAISIGTGGPFGAEGPIIMTGGALGSLFAQFFNLSSAERKTLLVAGAAAGMSATFDTPLAAILIAVELLLFEWKPRSFVPVAIASAVAAACRFWLLGPGPLFPMAPSPLLPPVGLLLAAALGIVGGIASGLLTGMVYKCEDFFTRLPIHWMWWPILGGLVVGVGGMFAPHALGVGYDNIGAMLSGHMTSGADLRLVIVKAIIWSVALGSGTSGGVLAPLLIMGGGIGALFGTVVPVADPGLWALIGMAAIMGGTMRSPLTGIVFALELTDNFGAILPLVIACTVAHATTVLLLKRSILTEKVARRGYHVMREYIVDPYESLFVNNVMAKPVDTLPDDMSVPEAIAFFTATDAPHRHKSYPIVDGNGDLAGLVSRVDVLRWIREGWSAEQKLRDVVKGRDVVVGYGDELIGRLVDRMIVNNVGRIPILRRGEGKKVVGLVARRDLLRIRGHLNTEESERERVISFRKRRPIDRLAPASSISKPQASR
ncbi:MAG: chloride channel protein [Stellaceae bacterium]